MTHPRTFLFVLLLATVMCFVVVQFGLDNWMTTGTVFRLALDPNGTDVEQRNRSYLLPPPSEILQLASTNATIITTTTTQRPARTSLTPSPKQEKPSVNPLILAPGPPKNYLPPSIIKNPYAAFLYNETHFKPVVNTRTSVEISVRSYPGQVAPLNPDSNGAVWKQFGVVPHRTDSLSRGNALGRPFRGQAIPLSQGKYNAAPVVGSRQKTDPYRVLQNVPVANSDKVVRVILVAYFRCGSTFVGDILQQNWKTFYHFEPLHYMNYDQRIGEEKLDEALNLLSSLFRCNFTQFPNYVRWTWRPENRFLFRRNLYLWYMCRARPFVCFMPDFLSAVCERSTYQVMKVTRLHMRHVELFIRRNPDLNVKVVYLVRDPRGIISSRKGLDWCNSTNCSDPSALCTEMSEDIQVSNQIQQADPGRCIRLRYEDVCIRPESESRNTFAFLGLPFSRTAEKFLKTHTVAKKADGLDPYSTRRNSSTVPYIWRQRLNFSEVANIQDSCASVINDLGYKMVNSPLELLDNSRTNQTRPTHKPVVWGQKSRENG